MEMWPKYQPKANKVHRSLTVDIGQDTDAKYALHRVQTTAQRRPCWMCALLVLSVIMCSCS